MEKTKDSMYATLFLNNVAFSAIKRTLIDEEIDEGLRQLIDFRIKENLELMEKIK